MKTHAFSRKHAWHFAVLVTLSCFIPASAEAQTCGLLTNSGFESDLAGWTSAGTTVITSDVHSGAKAARVGPAEGGLNRSGLIPVSAGQSLTFQFWAKVAGGPSWAGVGVDFLNSSGTELSEINLQVTSTVVRAALGHPGRARGRGQRENLDLEERRRGEPLPRRLLHDGPATRGHAGAVGAFRRWPPRPSHRQPSRSLERFHRQRRRHGLPGFSQRHVGRALRRRRRSRVTGLTAGTSHAMTVRARDAAGNWSAQSAALNVTTAPAAPSSCGALTNPGFESGLAGWTNDGNTSISSSARSGASAASTGPAAGGLHYAEHGPRRPAGQTVALRAWGRVSGCSVVGGHRPRLPRRGGQRDQRSGADRHGRRLHRVLVHRRSPRRATARVSPVDVEVRCRGDAPRGRLLPHGVRHGRRRHAGAFHAHRPRGFQHRVHELHLVVDGVHATPWA